LATWWDQRNSNLRPADAWASRSLSHKSSGWSPLCFARPGKHPRADLLVIGGPVRENAGKLDDFREPASVRLAFDFDPEDDRHVMPPSIAVWR